MIPTYNASKWINKTITNIQKQKDNNFKIIFRDDCSTDDTYAILQRFAAQDPRVRVIKSNQNIGLGPQRRELIKLVNTEYCAFLDDDDLMHKNAIKKFNKILEKNDYDIITGENWIWFNVMGMWFKFPNFINKLKKDEVPLYYVSRNMIFWWGSIFRTQFLQNLDFSFLPRDYEDIHSVPWLYSKAKTLKSTKIHFINYLKRKNSISSFSDFKLSDRFEIINKEYDKFFSFAQSIEDNKLSYSLIRSKMISYIQLLCNFYFKVSRKNKRWILGWIVTDFVPFAKRYGYYYDFPKNIMEMQILFFPKIKYLIKKLLKKPNVK